MGHTSIRTTLKFYARFLAAADDRALALLDSFTPADPRGRELDAKRHG